MNGHCADCKNWNQVGGDGVLKGECRSGSPIAIGEYLHWPVTLTDDWCGEFSDRLTGWTPVGDAANSVIDSLRKRMKDSK